VRDYFKKKYAILFYTPRCLVEYWLGNKKGCLATYSCVVDLNPSSFQELREYRGISDNLARVQVKTIQRELIEMYVHINSPYNPHANFFTLKSGDKVALPLRLYASIYEFTKLSKETTT
jgi:hypothetical protein